MTTHNRIAVQSAMSTIYPGRSVRWLDSQPMNLFCPISHALEAHGCVPGFVVTFHEVKRMELKPGDPRQTYVDIPDINAQIKINNMLYKDIFWSAYFSSFKIANLSIYRTKVDCTPRISLVEHWQVLERHLDKVADSRKWDLRSIVGAKEQPEREVQHIRSYLWNSRHMWL